MIKLIISDVDGVLAVCKDIHYNALNQALLEIDNKYFIGYNDHISKFDGLPTKRKLDILSSERGLPKDLHKKINDKKQEWTVKLVKSNLEENPRLISVFNEAKQKGLKVCAASNAIRDSVKLILLKTGLMECFDEYLGNEDAKNNKPHPEIYLQAMVKFGVKPNECVILEDSAHGKHAAHASGAFVFPVESPESITSEKLFNFIDECNKQPASTPWVDPYMNLLIPMCGPSDDFFKAGWNVPKFLIDLNGKPVIQRVLESLNIDCKKIFVLKRSDFEKYNLQYFFNLLDKRSQVVLADGPTEGIVSTTLLAKDLINNNNRLMIAHEDQLVDWNSSDFCYNMIASDLDAQILCFKNNEKKFSYSLEEFNKVKRVREKEVISDNANCGIYSFKYGHEYVKYSEQLINKNIRVNGYFYDSMVLDEYAKDNRNVKIHLCKSMKCLGYPEDIKSWIASNSV